MLRRRCPWTNGAGTTANQSHLDLCKERSPKRCSCHQTFPANSPVYSSPLHRIGRRQKRMSMCFECCMLHGCGSGLRRSSHIYLSWCPCTLAKARALSLIVCDSEHDTLTTRHSSHLARLPLLHTTHAPVEDTLAARCRSFCQRDARRRSTDEAEQHQ